MITRTLPYGDSTVEVSLPDRTRFPSRGLGGGPGDEVTVTSNTVNGASAQARLRVVGVFHTGLREFDDAVFRIPLAQAQRLLGTDRVETVSLGLASVADWSAVESSVRERHPELEATPFQVLDEVYYQHSVDWLAAQFGVIQLIILAILLLGIFNTVSTAVLERKQEIGNLRANGESVLDVLRLLGAEGLVLGSLGALLGIAVALVLNETVLAHGILMPPAWARSVRQARSRSCRRPCPWFPAPPSR